MLHLRSEARFGTSWIGRFLPPANVLTFTWPTSRHPVDLPIAGPRNGVGGSEQAKFLQGDSMRPNHINDYGVGWQEPYFREALRHSERSFQWLNEFWKNGVYPLP